MIIDNQKLEKIWKKYIDIKIYRLITLDQKKQVLKKGINPKKDPHKTILPKIKKMFNIIKRLEKKGIIFEDIWGKKKEKVKGTTIINVSLRSIKGNYIDFVSQKKQIARFKKRWKGGCLATYVDKLNKFLISNKSLLNKDEQLLIKSIEKWANDKRKQKYFLIYIKGSEKIFENAKFYCFNKNFKRYWKSPFGSLDNFKKTVKKNGLKKYPPYIKNEKLFYLRVVDKIPAKIIGIEK
jgi:hypothetical protein